MPWDSIVPTGSLQATESEKFDAQLDPRMQAELALCKSNSRSFSRLFLRIDQTRLPPGVVCRLPSKQLLVQYFSAFGAVTDCYTPESASHVAYLCYLDSEAIDAVLLAGTTHWVHSVPVLVQKAYPRPDYTVLTDRVFVKNLPPNFSRNELRSYFSMFGEVVDVYIPKDRVTMTSKSFAFITFRDCSACRVVLSFADHAVPFMGGYWPLQIAPAEPRPVSQRASVVDSGVGMLGSTVNPMGFASGPSFQTGSGTALDTAGSLGVQGAVPVTAISPSHESSDSSRMGRRHTVGPMSNGIESLLGHLNSLPQPAGADEDVNLSDLAATLANALQQIERRAVSEVSLNGGASPFIGGASSFHPGASSFNPNASSFNPNASSFNLNASSFNPGASSLHAPTVLGSDAIGSPDSYLDIPSALQTGDTVDSSVYLPIAWLNPGSGESATTQPKLEPCKSVEPGGGLPGGPTSVGMSTVTSPLSESGRRSEWIPCDIPPCDELPLDENRFMSSIGGSELTFGEDMGAHGIYGDVEGLAGPSGLEASAKELGASASELAALLLNTLSSGSSGVWNGQPIGLDKDSVDHVTASLLPVFESLSSSSRSTCVDACSSSAQVARDGNTENIAPSAQ